MTKFSITQRIRKAVETKLNTPFVKNAATLASGSAASQAIAIMFAPFLTRLYGPEAFGLQGIFISTIGILATMAAFSYPTAIVLPRNSSDALQIVKISALFGLVTASISALVLVLYGDSLLEILNANELKPYIGMISLAMIFSVLGSILSQWLVREEAFRIIATTGVVLALLGGFIKIVVGSISPTAHSLILTNIIMGFFGTLISYFIWRLNKKNLIKIIVEKNRNKKLWEVVKEYKDFPLYRTPQNLISAISQSLPVFLLAGFFGASSAGQYTIAITVLGVPSGLIASSVMSVFYPKVTDAIYNGLEPRKLIIKTTVAMAAVGIVPFLIVLFFGPSLFQFIFGESWRTAGVYAQLLSVWLFFQYVNKPAVAAIPALNIQGGLLIYELFSTGSKIISLWFGFLFFKSDVVALAMFSISGVIAYIWLMYWVIRKSKLNNDFKGR